MCHMYCKLHLQFFSVIDTDVGMQQVAKTWPTHAVVKYIANCSHLPCINHIYIYMYIYNIC